MITENADVATAGNDVFNIVMQLPNCKGLCFNDHDGVIG